MRPNTSIILGIQQPDVGAATSQALNNAGVANALRSRANMGEFLRANGGSVLSGDQNALRALSQLGPEGFQMAQGQQAHQMGQKQTQLSMDATRQRMRILDAQQAQAVADRASQLSAQERADAAQELETTIKMLSTTRDPQSWDAMAQNLNPGMVGRFGEREALLAQYMDVKDVIAMGQPAKPQSTLGKFYADQQAGHIPEDQAPPQSGTNVTVNTGQTGDSAPMIGTVPQGYQAIRGADGNYRFEPIKGGPEDTTVFDERAALAYDQKFAIVDDNINKALASLDANGRWVAGAGSLLSMLPETESRDFQAVLDTIKANLGFEELNAMRESSPTGGALGQVTEREIAFLQAVQGNLDAAQSPEQLAEVLREIQVRRSEFRAERQRIMSGQPEQAQPQGAVLPPPPNGIASDEWQRLWEHMPEEDRELFR